MEEEQKVEEGTVTTETETPTDLKEDQDYIALLKEAKEEGKREAEETYKGIQRTVAKKDLELEALRKQPEVRTGTPMSKQVIDLMEGGEFDKARNLIAVQEQESAKRATIQQQAQISEGHRSRIKQEIVDSGHNPNDEIFEDVFDAIDLSDAIDGKFERADRKLTRVLKANPKKEPEATPSAEEKALAWIKENNPSLLKTETGSPSASSQEWEKVRDKFIEEPNNRANTETYNRMRRERGI